MNSIVGSLVGGYPVYIRIYLKNTHGLNITNCPDTVLVYQDDNIFVTVGSSQQCIDIEKQIENTKTSENVYIVYLIVQGRDEIEIICTTHNYGLARREFLASIKRWADNIDEGEFYSYGNYYSSWSESHGSDKRRVYMLEKLKLI